MANLLLFGDSERSAALRHEVPIAIMDPFLFAEVDGRPVVLTTLLERDRIAAVLPEAELLDVFALGFRRLIEEGRSRDEALREVVALAVRQIGLRDAIVPGDFPLAVADRCGRRGRADRRRRRGRRAPAGKAGAELDGPLPAGLPIQVDLWPRHEETGSWADMTRTFVVGEPDPEHAELIAAQEHLVRAALEGARAAVAPGVTGRALYDATCERFEAAGLRTQRTGPGDDPSEGFQFALGHGVGLEVHEEPVLGLAGGDPLVAGDVLAIEPGLWDRRIGGVRFEDLLLVTDDGCETLTRYPYALSP